MSQKIQVRRGLKSWVTANRLDIGELGFCTDTQELYIGTATANKLINDLNWSSILGKPTFSAVATSGSYNDLTNKPTAYSLPTASSSILGGIKVGTGLSIAVDGTLSATGGGGGGGTTTNLDGLSDVEITSTPADGSVLKYIGGVWKPGTDIASAGGSGGNNTFPNTNVVVFDAVTVGSFYFSRDVIQLGTVTLA